jgi:hypothetical protein
MPLYKKGNTAAFNAWRKKYRERKQEEGLCRRCFRPLVEESGLKNCVNCIEEGMQRSKMSEEFYRGAY